MRAGTMPSFKKIRERAAKRKGGEAVLNKLLGARPDNAALAKVPDNRILSTMAERIFSAGFVWSVIEAKWPGFEEAFLGFEPKTLLFQPEDFWHDLTSDKRIVRNGQKIMSVRDNAAFVDRISKEHGSFGKFLAAWPADDQIGLTAYLGEHGSRLGGATGRYFLRWLGWDTYIVSRDMAAALREAGLDIAEAPTSKKDLQKVQDQINAWVKETGLPRMHISRILSMSIGENNPPEVLQAYMGE
jgi:3-methyladenine DNA glycosylase Tag